jgi:hypothetical protein
MKIQEKLQKVQLELKVHKGQKNKFGNYNYRSAEDILEAIKPLQDKYKVVFTIKEELKDVAGLPYIESVAYCYDLDSEGSVYSVATALVDLDAKGMQMPQRTGSASSYAKKYALGNLLLIDDTKDSDALNTHEKSSSEAKPLLKVGTEEFKKVKLAIDNGYTMEQVELKYTLTEQIKKLLTTK